MTAFHAWHPTFADFFRPVLRKLKTGRPRDQDELNNKIDTLICLDRLTLADAAKLAPRLQDLFEAKGADESTRVRNGPLAAGRLMGGGVKAPAAII
jgi:hypothetical protein